MKNVVSVRATTNVCGVAAETKVDGIIYQNKLGKNWKFKYLRFSKKFEKL